MKTTDRSPFHSKHAILITGLFIACLTFILYIPALQNNFVNWDDPQYVYENHNIQNFDIIYILQPNILNWHPLTMFSHALDYSLWGLNPFGHHLTSILLHSLNTLLVFILIKRIMEYNIAVQSDKKPLIVGVITALLFGIHPLHVESVAWISERKDVLCAFFFLLSIILYVDYVKSEGQKKSRAYWSSLALFFMALISKPMAVSLPIVLMILDYYPFKRITLTEGLRNSKGVILEKIPFIFLSFLFAMITIWAQESGEAIQTIDRIPVIARIFVATHAYMFYLAKMVVPINLVNYYPYPTAKEVFISSANIYIVCLITWIIVTYIAFKFSKKNNLFSAIWFYYIITLMPVIGLVQVGSQGAADRYTYLPSLGPFFLAGLAAAFCYKKNQPTIIIFLTLVFGAFSWMTIEQIKLWHNSITLWTHQISIFPDRSTKAYNSRASAYYVLGRYEKAIDDYNNSIRISPKNSRVYNYRGNIYLELATYDKAIKDFNRAIELDPKYAEAYHNRGVAFKSKEMYEMALEDYDKAIEINPKGVQTFSNRGSLYLLLGKPDQALKDFGKAIEINPEHVGAYINRGHYNLTLNRPEEAIRDFNIASGIDPENGKTYYNLGVAFSNLGNISEAIKNYTLAIEINPRYIEAYNNRGAIYKTAGKYHEAIRDFNEAIKLNKADVNAYYNRGMTFSIIGSNEMAIKDFEMIGGLNPHDAEIHFIIGLVYMASDDMEKAENSMKKAASMGVTVAQDYLSERDLTWD